MNAVASQYAGFWVRFAATLIDTLFLLIIITPLLLYFYGLTYFTSYDNLSHGPLDFFLWNILPILLTLIFWKRLSATPGKLAMGIKIVDAATHLQPSSQQFIIRYIAYFISTIPLCLGFIWIAFDSKKQGWHDKIAKTCVVHINK